MILTSYTVEDSFFLVGRLDSLRRESFETDVPAWNRLWTYETKPLPREVRVLTFHPSDVVVTSTFVIVSTICGREE